MTDVNVREIAIFLPLIALVFWMGIYPSSFINPMAPALEKVITRYNSANPDRLHVPVDDAFLQEKD